MRTNGIRDFRPYRPDRWEPPPWLRDRSIWDRAVVVFHAPPADDAKVFINRDYHLGNVLFRRGKRAGVVDWQARRDRTAIGRRFTLPRQPDRPLRSRGG